jgi:hypothetical protein
VPHFQVYYKREFLQPPYERPKFIFSKVYAEVGSVEARDLEELAHVLNSPSETVRATCQQLRVHTLLLPDDVVRDEAGTLWLRQLKRWKKLGS